MSTVIVAANVVEMFAVDDHASEKRSRVRASFARVAGAPLVAGEPPVFERDHALAHLVDDLAVCATMRIVVRARSMR